jgi:hypothetical protein
MVVRYWLFGQTEYYIHLLLLAKRQKKRTHRRKNVWPVPLHHRWPEIE